MVTGKWITIFFQIQEKFFRAKMFGIHGFSETPGIVRILYTANLNFVESFQFSCHTRRFKRITDFKVEGVDWKMLTFCVVSAGSESFVFINP